MRVATSMIVAAVIGGLCFFGPQSQSQEKKKEGPPPTALVPVVSGIILLGCGDYDPANPTDDTKWNKITPADPKDDPEEPEAKDKVNDNNDGLDKVFVTLTNDDGFECYTVKCKIFTSLMEAKNAPMIPLDNDTSCVTLTKVPLSSTIFQGENVKTIYSIFDDVKDFNHYIVVWGYFKKGDDKTMVVRYPAKGKALGFIVEKTTCSPDSENPPDPDMLPPPPMMQSSQP